MIWMSVSCLALSIRFWARKRAECNVRGKGWNSGFDFPNAFKVATDGKAAEVGLAELWEFIEDRRDPFGEVAALPGERNADLCDGGREAVAEITFCAGLVG